MVTVPDPITEPDPPDSEVEQEEVDYQAKAVELEAQVAKLENDLRSKGGQRRRDTDRDAELAGFKDELSAIRRVLTTYMDSYGGSPEVQQQINEINQEVAQNNSTRDFQSRYDKEQERLISMVQDADGNLLISEDDATKLQTQWQNAWQKAQQDGPLDSIYDVHFEAQRMVLQEERRTADTEKQRLRSEAKDAGKRALEKAGINDLDTGAAMAGGSEELHGTALIERGLRSRSRILN
jgi:hypothetical protein